MKSCPLTNALACTPPETTPLPVSSGLCKPISGADRLGQWSIESRHVVDDYIAAFGEPPNDNIHAVVLFTDNDQTSEPVVAYYEWAKLTCMNE
jgi:hypothetical protein